MSTSPIGATTTSPVTPTTTATAATAPVEPKATTTPAASNVVDAFESAPAKAPVALTTPVTEDEDEWADGPAWQKDGSGGGGPLGVDPNSKI